MRIAGPTLSLLWSCLSARLRKHCCWTIPASEIRCSIHPKTITSLILWIVPEGWSIHLHRKNQIVYSLKCAELLNAISGKHWTQNVIDSMAAYFEHPIRKLAHFSEYACMGVLLYGVWRPWKERNRKLYLLIVLWVFVSAGADEFHQLFVPGRYGCFADVVLDTCGGAFGLLVCVCVEKIVRRRKQKRKDNEK